MDQNRGPDTTGAAAQSKREAPPAPLAPGLYLVATPIGNLQDITLRALDTLRGVDAVACEDTRVTGKLLKHYGISTPTLAYHEHNAAKVRPGLLKRLEGGQRIALVSDAGSPLISDPGYRLVEEATAAGAMVTSVPGASATLTGLQLSGLPTDRFFFAGFLPPKQGARRSALDRIAAVPSTLVFFETGPRLAASLADMAAKLGDRPAAIARELTKLHEEVRRSTLAALAGHYADAPLPKGEIVVVVGPPPAAEPASAQEVDRLLIAALETHSVRDAAATVAEVTGRARRDVYQRALRLAQERGG